ncbi:hypothetical protein H490_0102090 [Leucobacter sp. UCD-THU]|jgi:hypothetical protein|uniref:DUF4190 domain-containing protein n=1 Tax=Leucobacter muris TaxID=1935379 RepID=A0ABX5QGB3_9MICO|nr:MULTISPECIES: DUF4190 domain-containing protein [Leucobacter]EYT56313.1 hypothetical protein H490_0102090 [Leucobacter sp. UCD-THU]QAB18097.1 DUF4190 domain-containing protein [Leucobacter muris]
MSETNDPGKPTPPETPAPPVPPVPPAPPAPPVPPAQPEQPSFSDADAQPTTVTPQADGGQQPTTALPQFEGGQSADQQPTTALPQSQPQRFDAAPPAPPLPPQQPAPGAGYPTAPQAPMNTLAIVAFIASFFVSLAGIICGHIALGQIKKTGERGRGFALAGTIIGYVSLAITVIAVIFSIIIAATAVSVANESLSQLEQTTQELEDSTDFDALTEEPGVEESPGATAGDRSPEFCAAIDAVATASEGATGAEVPPELLDAYRQLSEIDSPNRAVYERFYLFATDPTSAAGEDMSALMEEYFDAAMDDAMACM